MNVEMASKIVLAIAVTLVGLTAIHLILAIDDLVRMMEPMLRACAR
jgi:hypothetical protein